MRYANGKLRFRTGLTAVALAGLIAGPAFAFGAMGGFGPGFGGGFHGGFHGAFHGGGFRPPTPQPPFIRPPPMHFHDFHHDRFHAHNRFHNGWGWGWGGWGWGWGGGVGAYQVAEAQPAYAAPEPPRVAEPPPCPELLTWSPKLGRATRQRLCDGG